MYNDRYTLSSMTKHADILAGAEAVFERSGFAASPMDAVVAAACVSPRTLYKHFSSKAELACAVLEARHQRFLDALAQAAAGSGVSGALSALEAWLESTPAQGCLFLRASGEFEHGLVDAPVAAYKRALADLCAGIAAAEGRAEDGPALTLLIEGATAMAPFSGASAAVEAARKLWAAP